MPRRLIAFTCAFFTLLGFGAADAFILTRALCNRHYVEGLLKDALHRDCRFDRMKPIPFHAISVHKLRLESAWMPRDLPVFQIARVNVSFAAGELLRGQIVPSEVVLDTPELNFLQNRLTGECELRSLLETLALGKEGPSGPPQALPLFIVHQGLVRLQDEDLFAEGRIQEVHDVEATLRPYRGTSSLLEGSLVLEGVGRFEVTGEIDFARSYYRIDLASPKKEPIRLGTDTQRLLANKPGHWLRDAWGNYQPDGPVDLRVTITHDPSKANPDDFTVFVDPHGISVTAKAFPLPVDQATGHLEFRQAGARIQGMKCRSGATRVEVDGTTDGYEQDAGFHLKIDMDDLPLDGRLKNALKPPDQKTYDLFHPSGIVHATAEVDRPRGENASIRNHIWIRCKDAAFLYQRFPYPIERVQGEIELDGEEINVKGVAGMNGPMQILVNGKIVDISGDSDIHMRVEGSNIPLDHRLYEALGAPTRRVWDRLKPEGTVGLVWEGDRERGSERDLAQHVTMVLDDAKVTYDGFPYSLDHLHGNVVYDSEKQTVDIKGVEASHGGAQARVSGSVRDISGDGTFSLSIEGTDVPLDADLRNALSPENQKVWDRLRPDGRVDITWDGHGVGGANKDIRQTLKAKLKGCAATWEKVPLRVSELTGHLTYDESGTRIDHVTGKNREAEVTLDGTIGQGDDPQFDLTVSVAGLPLDKDVVESLPERPRGLLTDWKAKGNVDLSGRFEQRDDSGGKRRTLYSAEVRFADTDLDVGTPLSKLEGRVQLSGEVDEKAHRARGAAELGRVRVNGKLITKLHGQFVYEDDRLVFQGLRGDCYEGHLEGDMKIEVPTGEFQTELKLSGLDLRTFARDTFVSEKQVSGTLEAHAFVRGTAKDRETWTGILDVDVRDGELWEVPFFYRIFSVLSLTDDRKGKFETGKVHAVLGDGKFHVKPLDFQSPNVRLEGRGTVGYDGSLKLQLNSHLKSVGLGPLNPLFSIFDPITKNLYAIEAQGTFQEPEMSLRPLPFMFNDDEDKKKSTK